MQPKPISVMLSDSFTIQDFLFYVSAQQRIFLCLSRNRFYCSSSVTSFIVVLSCLEKLLSKDATWNVENYANCSQSLPIETGKVLPFVVTTTSTTTTIKINFTALIKLIKHSL